MAQFANPRLTSRITAAVNGAITGFSTSGPTGSIVNNLFNGTTIGSILDNGGSFIFVLIVSPVSRAVFNAIVVNGKTYTEASASYLGGTWTWAANAAGFVGGTSYDVMIT